MFDNSVHEVVVYLRFLLLPSFGVVVVFDVFNVSRTPVFTVSNLTTNTYSSPSVTLFECSLSSAREVKNVKTVDP